MDEKKSNIVINFKSDLQLFVMILFILIFFFFIYLQINNNGFEILIIMAIPILSYIFFDFFNTIDHITYNDDFLILKKKTKILSLRNVSLINITHVKISNSVVLKVILENGKSIIGFLPYTKIEFEELIDLLNKIKINFKEETKLIKIF